MVSDNRLTLENDFLRVAFVRHGAELQQLYSKKEGIDLLWSGDAEYWGKYSPILFPFVGTLKNNEYIYREVSYQMGRHGFARDKVFQVVSQSMDTIEFKLVFDEETLRIYPFEFELVVQYRIFNDSLSCTYKVSNKSSRNSMFYSIGAHPAFVVPFDKQYSYRDYFIKFDQDTALERYPLTSEGLLHLISVPVELDEGKLLLSNDLFYRDALVFKQFSSRSIILGNQKDNLVIHMDISEFPYLGIWSARNAPFVCLEPWLGIADSKNHDKKLEKKEGIVKLEPNKEMKKSWSIRICREM